MNVISTPLLLVVLLGADSKPTPKVPIGKETTYITEPIDKEGYLDYEAALNERLKKGITPENNANVLLWKAFGPAPEGGRGMPKEFFKQLGIKELPKEGEYFIGLQNYMKDHLKLDENEWETLIDQQSQASQRPWSTKDFPKIADWLKANEKPLALVFEATKRSEYFNPMTPHPTDKGPGGLIAVLLPGVQKCRELCTGLLIRAMLQMNEEKFDEAWQDILASHRLARLLYRGTTLIETLVAISVEQRSIDASIAYLEKSKLTPKQIQDRLKDLENLPPIIPLANKIDLGERFMYLDSLQMIRRGGFGVLEGLAGSGRPTKQVNEEMEKALASIDWEPAFRTGNEWYDRLVKALQGKDRLERTKELNKIEDDLIAMKKEMTEGGQLAQILLGKEAPNKVVGKSIGNILITLLMPAVTKVHDAYDRIEQGRRNQQIAFALVAYHRDNNRYPDKLNELAPKYLPKVPNDIFSGKELIYKPSEKGYLLYSVGANGKDEEGRWFDDEPKGDDPRVRIPLPELKPKK